MIAHIHDYLAARGYPVATVRETDGAVQVVLTDDATDEQRAAAQSEAEAWAPTIEQVVDDRLERVDLPRRLLAALTLRAWPDSTPAERTWAAGVIAQAGERIREARS